MPNYNEQEAHQALAKFQEIQGIADNIAKVLNDAGLAQRHGSYLDERCEQIKSACLEISRIIHLGTGAGD